MLLEDLIFSEEHILAIYFIISFILFGVGVKLIDDIFDKKISKEWVAIVLAPLVGILWAISMASSPAAASILAAILIAAVLKGKINNIGHQIGLLTILVILFFSEFVQFLWIPLIVISLAAISDEIGHDFVEKNKKINKVANYFFQYRFAMKLAVFLFALFNYFGWIFFFAFMAFDIAYVAIEKFEIASFFEK